MNIGVSFTLFVFLTLTWAEDYYKLLGVERTADQRDIRKAFKKLAVTEHPDKKTDDPDAHVKFIKLTTAYEVLKDPDLRKKYDLYGEDGLDDSKSRRNYHSYTYYQNNFGIYDDDPQIVTLNINDYFESVTASEKMWFINFYSPQCSHCHHLAPVWRKLAKKLEGVIRIGAVNCEDDWHLCSQVGIQSYPTLLYYPVNSHQGLKYKNEKTYEAIMKFVLDKLHIDIPEISKSVWTSLLKGKGLKEKPMLIFICKDVNYCFTSDERLRVAATFDKMIHVKVFECKDSKCHDIISDSTTAVYLPSKLNADVKPTLINDIVEVEDLVKKILEQLPEPQDINDDEYNDILGKVTKKSGNGWLFCFYIGHDTDLDILLKQLPSVLKDVALGKINCGRYSKLCKKLNINRYPTWAVLKPGGAFEISHGKNRMNDVANFAKNSLKAENVWALSADKVHSILNKESGEAWFLDWYAPWCPPCLKFLPEVRKASLEFDSSVVHFGTVDCTTHSDICKRYNIQSYPTATLVNGTNTFHFTTQRTASHIIEFINEAMNPTVLHLTSKSFNQKLGKKRANHLWIVDYFAPWCKPCQQLASEWTGVAKALKLLSFVKVASVDCEAEKSICSGQNVRSYPTIRLYPIGSEGLNSVVLYSGQRDTSSLLKFVTQFLPVKVQELNEANLEKAVLKTDDVVLVDYFAPWCSHCIILEPQFAIAAQLLEGKVRLARLNCEQYHYQCSQAGIRAYPTLALYTGKRRGRRLTGSTRLSATRAESIRDEVLDLLPRWHDEL
ncbi:PREDICTED: dnaJ homolog subfamily C member 10-like [Ceratosolen solmsi marchali]|uniref:DnaJ homolog subfamily C member 16 n=1 Tax=Ceratosolen solmsi marchali TaxID=326594 RepID=A0AAJ6YIR1_9HYME|nr:PREDICTED: dnaJ homolog subfamily C member 10-like [Ceratosolen solmsi marchali]